MAENGVLPSDLAEQTPFQWFTMFFTEHREPVPDDPRETLYRINLDREAKGERPAIPHWWGDADKLPRKSRAK